MLNPSHDSSIGSISASYRGGSGFKSRQGQEFFSENKSLDCLNLNTNICHGRKEELEG